MIFCFLIIIVQFAGIISFQIIERCFCNKRGSLEPGCDPITRQCKCKPGISGIKCNRCEPGFWGLHKIRGNEGCLRQ